MCVYMCECVNMYEHKNSFKLLEMTDSDKVKVIWVGRNAMKNMKKNEMNVAAFTLNERKHLTGNRDFVRRMRATFTLPVMHCIHSLWSKTFDEAKIGWALMWRVVQDFWKLNGIFCECLCGVQCACSRICRCFIKFAIAFSMKNGWDSSKRKMVGVCMCSNGYKIEGTLKNGYQAIWSICIRMPW